MKATAALHMIDPDQALALVAERARPRPAESVPLEAACGLVCAGDVVADRDYPPFDRAMMDGFAVRVADAGRTVEVAGEAPAGRISPLEVVPGRCVEIMTGAPCPPGTEAIAPVETVRREGSRVTLPGSIAPGRHIAPAGSDCAAGAAIVKRDDVVTPVAVGALASCGRARVKVIPRPTIAIVITGGELVAGDDLPEPGLIRDSNGPMLEAMARRAGLDIACRTRAKDTPAALAEALARAAAADIIVLSGGVSAGRYDLVPQALEAFGAEIVFHKVTQKPGKPLIFAARGAQLLFGVPGNPLSAHMCFFRYVAPAVRLMAGRPAEEAPLPGRLKEAVSCRGGRERFLLARAAHADGRLAVTPLPGASSADIFTTSSANGYIRVSADLPAGAAVGFYRLDKGRWTS